MQRLYGAGGREIIKKKKTYSIHRWITLYIGASVTKKKKKKIWFVLRFRVPPTLSVYTDPRNGYFKSETFILHFSMVFLNMFSLFVDRFVIFFSARLYNYRTS